MCFISFDSDESNEEEEKNNLRKSENDHSQKAVKMMIRKSLGLDNDNDIEKLPIQKQSEPLIDQEENIDMSDDTKSEKVQLKVSNEDDKIIYELNYTIIPELRNRGESYLKALAHDLLAEFFLYRNMKVKAKNNWIECLDSIFKQVCILEHFNSLFDSKANKTDFVLLFGQQKLYLSLLILFKLSKYIFLNK
jgi:hypothetical protein